MAASGDAGASDESLKLAIAVSLFRSKFMKNVNKSNSLSPSRSDALLRWKQKVRNPSLFPSESEDAFFLQIFFIWCLHYQAKERKQEILRLREDLKQAQGSISLLLTHINSCHVH